MDIKTYSEEIKRTVAPIDKEKNNIHFLMGMITEIGELTDAFKKNLAYGKEVDWTNVVEELGDLMWYVINFCNENSINLEDALQINIDKLRIRYPEKFTQTNATIRNLPAERKVLSTCITGEMSFTDVGFEEESDAKN